MDIFGFENLSEDSFLQLATTNKDRRVHIRKRKIPWCNSNNFCDSYKAPRIRRRKTAENTTYLE